MTKEEFLICACRAYVKNERIPFESGIDERAFYNLAHSHNLTPFCAISVDFKDGRLKERFQNDLLDAFYLSNRQTATAQELFGLLRENDFYYIAFKGIKIRELYPTPESRLMGDIDVLIKKSDKQAVKKLLVKSGFLCTAQNGPVYNFEKNGVLIEVHSSFGNEYCEGCFASPFDYAKFDGYAGELDVNYQLAYLIVHTAHHFRFRGAGVRMVLDIAVMLTYSNADVDAVLSYLAQCSLERFGKEIFTVCEKWFCVGRDFGVDTQKTESFLFSSGIFGAQTENKGTAIARKDLEIGKKVSPFRSKLRLLFPSYSRLKKIDYIRFIDGRPWLTPYAWVYRFIFNIKHRRAFMTSAVNALSDDETKNQAQEQLDYFREIGIYGN